MANEAKLQLLLDLDDKVSDGLKKVNGNLDTFKSQIDKMQPVFKGMAATGTAAFVAVGAEIYKSIQSADEAAKVQAQLEAVLNSTGHAAGLYAEDILDQSTALQKMTTYSDEAITSSANLLLTFTNIKGAVFQEALPAILDMSTAMGTDLKSSAIQVGKALNDPVNGMSALQRVGVQFTDAQKEVVAQMVATGKTADAQRFILSELNKEFGGSATAAAKTFSGQLEQLKNRIDDVQEKIGGALIPIITSFAEKLGPILDKVIAWIEENPKLTATILVIVAAISGLIAVVGFLGIALAGLGSVAAALGITLGAFLGWLLLIPLAIAAVIAIGVLLYKHWDDIKLKAAEVWQFVVDAWNSMKDAIIGAWQAVIDFLSSVWEAIKNIFWTGVDFIIGAWAMLLNFLFPGWQAQLTAIWQFAVQIWENIKTAFSSAFESIKTVFTGWLDELGKAWSELWTGVKDVFTDIWNSIAAVFDSIIGGISSGMEKLVSPIQKVIDLAQRALSLAGGVVKSVGGAISSGVKSIVNLGSSITGHATGGPVFGDTPTIVGEKGPELFIPSSSGKIMTNGALAGALSGGPNFYISITGNTLLDRDAVRKIGGEMVKYLKDNMRV